MEHAREHELTDSSILTTSNLQRSVSCLQPATFSLRPAAVLLHHEQSQKLCESNSSPKPTHKFEFRNMRSHALIDNPSPPTEQRCLPFPHPLSYSLCSSSSLSLSPQHNMMKQSATTAIRIRMDARILPAQPPLSDLPASRSQLSIFQRASDNR